MDDETLDPPSSWDRLRAYLTQRDEAAAERADVERSLSSAEAAGYLSPDEAEHLREHPDELPDAPATPRERQNRIPIPRAVDNVLRSRMVERVASLPTPGGNGLLILAILFFLFAIVPVDQSGNTRLLLIWKALTGGAHLPLSPAGVAREAERQQAASDNAAVAGVLGTVGKVAEVPYAISQSGDLIPTVVAAWEADATGVWPGQPGQTPAQAGWSIIRQVYGG